MSGGRRLVWVLGEPAPGVQPRTNRAGFGMYTWHRVAVSAASVHRIDRRRALVMAPGLVAICNSADVFASEEMSAGVGRWHVWSGPGVRDHGEPQPPRPSDVAGWTAGPETCPECWRLSEPCGHEDCAAFTELAEECTLERLRAAR